MIGTTIDQYRIEARLGGGGMGEVFRARDLELDRDVAIKLVRPELADLAEVTARFRAEARTLAGLAHSNIATVFRFFAHEGTLYLVMEYISGQPFGDMLRDKGALPATEVVRIMKQALSGLGYAHDNKVVHRDIKPGNLMLDGRDTVKVLDFGIAHLLDQTRMTQSGSVLGTPAYMAPEQVLGQQVDGRTDLYALGVVLYEMLTGKLPYRANSQFEQMRAHLETQPRSLKEMNERVPRPLRETIVQALAKQADDRFQSAAEFSAALEVALAESETDGGTLIAARRSGVAVSVGNTPQVSAASTESSGATPATVTRSASGTDQTELRLPTSVEIPLPEPKTAVGGAVAAILLAGAGIWWFASGETASDSAITQPGLNQTVNETANETLDVTVSQTANVPQGAVPPAFGLSVPSASAPSAPSAPSPSAPAEPVSAAVRAPASVPASKPPSTTVSPSLAKPAPRVVPQSTVSSKTAVGKTSSVPSSVGSYRVVATKVSAHDRQGRSRLSRAAGYNGSFALSVPRGGQAVQIDELVEVYRNGQQLTRQLIHSEVRKPGRFKSKQRIPGLKELGPGSYQMRLVFEFEGKALGQHEWTLIVSG